MRSQRRSGQGRTCRLGSRGIRMRLRDHQDTIGDSWQLMGNDDVKFP
jgi:hypothetical protein